MKIISSSGKSRSSTSSKQSSHVTRLRSSWSASPQEIAFTFDESRLHIGDVQISQHTHRRAARLTMDVNSV
jgi:hypothetical protein